MRSTFLIPPPSNSTTSANKCLLRYADQEALDKHMAGAPIQKIVKAVEEEKLTETKIIMTTRGPGITPRL